MRTFGWGMPSKSAINWGIAYKTWTRSDATNSSQGWSSDFGLTWQSSASTQWGFTLRDVLGDPTAPPFSATAGGDLRLNKTVRLAGGVGYKTDTQDTWTPYLGAELRLLDSLSIRGGWQDRFYKAGATFSLFIFSADISIMQSDRDSNLTVYRLGFQVGKGGDDA
jgi:hypothetical protein